MTSLTSRVNPKYIDLIEISTPDSPRTNNLRLYVEDFKGFSFFNFKDDTGMVRKIVRDSVFAVKATTDITIGQAVYATGSSGNVPTVSPALASAVATMPAIGIAVEAISAGNFGRVMQVGLIENIKTDDLGGEGQVVYVSAATAGKLTNVAPLYPNIRQEIGTVLVSGAGNGALQVILRSMFNEGIIDHGGLLGLDHDDHPQYIKAQTYAGDPTGNLVPTAVNYLCIDTTNHDLYIATTALNTGWRKFTRAA